MKPITIAIDGFSSTGKSTLAKKLAEKLGFVHIDSGAMYRAVTLYTLKNNFWNHEGVLDKKALLKTLPKIQITFQWNQNTATNEVYLNNQNVEQEIRKMEVSDRVSIVAQIPEVREAMVIKQRELADKHSVVMDGRDIGTMVFPDAELKFYLTASAKERAQRRFEELKSKGTPISLELVEENINQRDHLDLTRKISPLTKAPDAIEIDNGNLGIEATFEKVWEWVQKKV